MLVRSHPSVSTPGLVRVVRCSHKLKPVAINRWPRSGLEDDMLDAWRSCYILRTMSSTNQRSDDLLSLNERARRALNEHGYALQYAAIAAVQASEKCQWSTWCADFPVVAGNRDTRTDLVLRHKSHDKLLVIEAKRTDPRRSSWVFWRAANHPSSNAKESIILDEIKFGLPTLVSGVRANTNDPHLIRQVGLCARNEPKNNMYSDADSIESACSQVTAQTNGLIDYFCECGTGTQFASGSRLRIMPVILTTAPIYIAAEGLESATLASGRIEGEHETIDNCGWVWFQYPISQLAKHHHPSRGPDQDIARSTEDLFLRTIPIVNASRLRDFLSIAAETM